MVLVFAMAGSFLSAEHAVPSACGQARQQSSFWPDDVAPPVKAGPGPAIVPPQACNIAARTGDAAHPPRRSVHHTRLPPARPRHRRQPGPAARPVSGAGQQARSGAARTRQGPGPWNPDWLRTTLTVSGPATAVARFRRAANGTGGIPWHLDLDHEEARLLAPMAAAGIEARLLARDLRAVIAARHDRVLTL